jgi:hypothetical protein
LRCLQLVQNTKYGCIYVICCTKYKIRLDLYKTSALGGSLVRLYKILHLCNGVVAANATTLARDACD